MEGGSPPVGCMQTQSTRNAARRTRFMQNNSEITRLGWGLKVGGCQGAHNGGGDEWMAPILQGGVGFRVKAEFRKPPNQDTENENRQSQQIPAKSLQTNAFSRHCFSDI